LGVMKEKEQNSKRKGFLKRKLEIYTRQDCHCRTENRLGQKGSDRSKLINNVKYFFNNERKEQEWKGGKNSNQTNASTRIQRPEREGNLESSVKKTGERGNYIPKPAHQGTSGGNPPKKRGGY